MPLNGRACVGFEGHATIRRLAVEFSRSEVDLRLLQRIAIRDEAALAELYDRHSRLAYSVLMRILRNPADAEEVLQETFVRVWSRADTYDALLGSPAAWVMRIARNRAIDLLLLKLFLVMFREALVPGNRGAAVVGRAHVVGGLNVRYGAVSRINVDRPLSMQTEVHEPSLHAHEIINVRESFTMAEKAVPLHDSFRFFDWHARRDEVADFVRHGR